VSPTLRQPTPAAAAYRWYAAALSAKPGDDARAFDEDEPQPGFYKRRFNREGVFVPARIWLIQYVADGELIAPELIACEIGGDRFDPRHAEGPFGLPLWCVLAENPITKAEYDHMMRVRAWAKTFRPDQPEAAPMKSVDLFTVKPPTWGKRSKRKP